MDVDQRREKESTDRRSLAINPGSVGVISERRPLKACSMPPGKAGMTWARNERRKWEAIALGDRPRWSVLGHRR
jgi:hypothetical protein